MKAKHIIIGSSTIVFCVFVIYSINFVISVIGIKSKIYDGMIPGKTYTHLASVAKGCDKYESVNGRFPGSLSELLEGPPYLPPEWCTDGWGHVVVFIPYTNSVGYGSVISYGPNGRQAGAGDIGEIEVRFPVAANAKWNDQERVRLNLEP